MSAETFVISIYRRISESGTEVAGLVERAGSGERKSFSNSAELWEFLSGTPASRRINSRRRQTVQKKP